MIYPAHIHLYVRNIIYTIMMYDAQLYLINAREAQFAIINEVPFMPPDPPWVAEA